MSEMKNLQSLLKHELEDLYSAETQIIESLPLMIENAQDRLLKKSLQEHLKITRKQKARLDKVKKMLGSEKKEDLNLFQRLFMKDSGGEHCRAMEGLIDEANKMMAEDMERGVMDAAIIAAAQKIEHYEISSYGTAKAFARQLGLKKVEQLLDETLNEEYQADDLLTDLAVGKVNLEANGESVRGLRKLPSKGAAKKSTSAGGRSGSSGKRTAKRSSGKATNKKSSSR